MKLPIITTALAAFLLFASQISALAQDIKAATNSFSLKQAQEYALENNTSIKNAQLDIKMAEKKIWETKASGLPQLSASGTYTHLFGEIPTLNFGGKSLISNKREGETIAAVPTGAGTDSIFQNYFASDPIPLGVRNNATINFNVSQLIFSGEYIVGLQATKVFYQISQNSLISTSADVKELVANSYFLVLLMEQNKQILSQSLANVTKTLSDMKEMNKQGFIENTDLDQLELTVNTLENGIRSVDNQIAASYDLLKFQLGLPFENSVTLTDKLEDVITLTDIVSITSKQFQVQNHITYKIMENQEAAGLLNLKRQKSAYLPSLAAFYKHTENLKQAGIDFTMKDMAGISLNVPIFSSGMRNAMVQQREMELEKIRNDKSNVASGLELDFINSRNSFNSAYDQFVNEKRNIELTNRIYDKTLIKYKEGLSSSMDLTTAQNQYLSAQKNYFTALYTLLVSKNKLDKLLNN
jgi:outer membrane protein TolC